MLTDEARRIAESLRSSYGYSPQMNVCAAQTLEKLAEEVERLETELKAKRTTLLVSAGFILQASPTWIEFKNENEQTYLEVCGINMVDTRTYRVRYIGIEEYDDLRKEEYNKTWRAWVNKPTAEEMRDAEWDQ